MIRKVKAASDYNGVVYNEDEIMQADKRCLVGIQNKMKDLFDAIDSAPKGFAERYDLSQLFNELQVVIMETHYQLEEWNLV